MRTGVFDECISEEDICIKMEGPRQKICCNYQHYSRSIRNHANSEDSEGRIYTIGGVDHFDQIHSVYNMFWKSRR